jgi:hypothetical protein
MLRKLIWTGAVLLTAFVTFLVVSTFLLPTGQSQRMALARKISMPLRAIGAKARANGTPLEVESEDFDNSFTRQSELRGFAENATLELCNVGFTSLYFYRPGGLLQPNAGSRSPLACEEAQEASAHHSVDTLNVAERTYSDVYNAGFSHELSQLGPPTAGGHLGACPRKAISNQESITYRRFQVSNLLILRRTN